MRLTKVKATQHVGLGKKAYQKGSVFYASTDYREGNTTIDMSDIFDADGNFIGRIKGHWSYYDNKVFEAVKD